MISEPQSTKLDGIKQDIQEFKNEFNTLLSSLKNKIHSKSEYIETRLNQIKNNLEINIM